MRHEAYSRTFMEKYSSGRRGAPAKGVGRVTGAEVQIFSSPPKNDRFLPVVFLLLLNLDDIMYIDARDFGSCFAVFVFEVKRNALGL